VSARRFVAALVAGAVFLACGGGEGPTEPVPGTLELRLTTPNANDRAMLVTVAGPEPIQAVSGSVGSALVFHGRVSGSQATIAVFGPLTSGVVARVGVADVGRVSAYTVTIVEVADDANQLRPSLAGYSLTIVR